MCPLTACSKRASSLLGSRTSGKTRTPRLLIRNSTSYVFVCLLLFFFLVFIFSTGTIDFIPAHFLSLTTLHPLFTFSRSPLQNTDHECGGSRNGRILPRRGRRQTLERQVAPRHQRVLCRKERLVPDLGSRERPRSRHGRRLCSCLQERLPVIPPTPQFIPPFTFPSLPPATDSPLSIATIATLS